MSAREPRPQPKAETKSQNQSAQVSDDQVSSIHNMEIRANDSLTVIERQSENDGAQLQENERSISYYNSALYEEKYVPPESEFSVEIIDNDTCQIKRYIGNYLDNRREIVIPERISGRKVVASCRKAFINQKFVRSIVIPRTITEIGDSAFMECSNLRSVILHDGITKIDDWAFFECKNIETMNFGVGNPQPGVVYFPPGLKEIGQNAFSRHTRLFTIKTVCIFKTVHVSMKTQIKHNSFCNTNTCDIHLYDRI